MHVIVVMAPSNPSLDNGHNPVGKSNSVTAWRLTQLSSSGRTNHRPRLQYLEVRILALNTFYPAAVSVHPFPAGHCLVSGRLSLMLHRSRVCNDSISRTSTRRPSPSSSTLVGPVLLTSVCKSTFRKAYSVCFPILHLVLKT